MDGPLEWNLFQLIEKVPTAATNTLISCSSIFMCIYLWRSCFDNCVTMIMYVG